MIPRCTNATTGHRAASTTATATSRRLSPLSVRHTAANRRREPETPSSCPVQSPAGSHVPAHLTSRRQHTQTPATRYDTSAPETI